MAESIVINTYDTTVQSDGNGEDLSAGDDTLLVTSAGSIVDTNGDTAVNSTANSAIMTVDGLVYNAGSGTTGNGVVMSGSDSTLSVNGTVQGGYHGIFVGGGGTDDVVNVGTQGSIDGLGQYSYGVTFGGTGSYTGNSLFNAGDISGTIGVYAYDGSSDSIVNIGNISGYTGIYLDANVGEESIENSGTIAGVGASNSSGIASAGSESGVEIVNSGLITDSAGNPAENNAAVLFFDDAAGTLSTIDNKGTISGAGAVIQTLSDSLDVTNSGTIDGGLYAAAGAIVAVSNSGLWQSSGEPTGDEWSLNNNENILYNTGTIQCYIDMISGNDNIQNFGTIGGSITLSGSIGNNILVNGGTIGGFVQWVSGSGAITNSGVMAGGLLITVGAEDGGALDNSGSIDQGVTFAAAQQTLSNRHKGTISGGLIFDGGSDTIDNAGTIGGAVSIASGGDTVTNSASGGIDGAVAFTGTAATNSLMNAGAITGAVTMAGASSTLTNHGQIYGDVSLAANETLTNTGVIHGDLTLAGTDTVNTSRGEITGVINAGKTDTFEFSGNFGDETIDKFIAGSGSTHDTIQFAANDFGSFSAVQSAMSQVGSDVLIRLDATDSIVLNGVTLSNLVAADFKFV
jgi:hypothetical protein